MRGMFNLASIGVFGSVLAACGGEGGINHGDPVLGDDGVVCDTAYMPVCGKHDLGGFVCVDEPCLTKQYSTHSNLCNLDARGAQKVFEGECGVIEERFANEHPAVEKLSLSEQLPESAPVEIESAYIEGDNLFIDVNYGGGCGDHEFRLYTLQIDQISADALTQSNTIVMEDEAQVSGGDFVLHHITEDTCEALIVDTLQFDLIPLRKLHHDIFNDEIGQVMILGVVDDPLVYPLQ